MELYCLGHYEVIKQLCEAGELVDKIKRLVSLYLYYYNPTIIYYKNLITYKSMSPKFVSSF